MMMMMMEVDLRLSCACLPRDRPLGSPTPGRNQPLGSGQPRMTKNQGDRQPPGPHCALRHSQPPLAGTSRAAATF